MGALYQISFPNGKSYIGITTDTPEHRFYEHVKCAMRNDERALQRALRKHGPEKASLKTLVVADDWEYLTILEKRAIKVFGTKGHGGYNMTDGGDGIQGFVFGEESKKKMAAAKLGTHRSEETKKKIGLGSRGNKYAAGRVHPEEERLRRRDSIRGKEKGSSGHVGVTWHSGAKKWRAHLTLNYKFIHLGYHDSIEDAVRARVDGEATYFGKVITK